MLLLGGIYAFATDVTTKNRLAVEYVMLGSMVGAVVLAMIYLAYVWCDPPSP